MSKSKNSAYLEAMRPLAEKVFEAFVIQKQKGVGKMRAFRKASYDTYEDLDLTLKDHLTLFGVESKYIFAREISTICRSIYPPERRRTVAKAIINNLITRASQVREVITFKREEQTAEDKAYELWADYGIGSNPFLRKK